MKKLCFLLMLCSVAIVCKCCSPTFKLPTSLAKGEVAITFLDENVLLYTSVDTSFLLNLNESSIQSYVKKYHLEKIPVFSRNTVSTLDNLYITSDGMIKIMNGDQSFCIMATEACDFNYVYKNEGYLESDVYFYHKDTKEYVKDIINEKYDVSKDIITLVFDGKSYMVIPS